MKICFPTLVCVLYTPSMHIYKKCFKECWLWVWFRIVMSLNGCVSHSIMHVIHSLKMHKRCFKGASFACFVCTVLLQWNPVLVTLCSPPRSLQSPRYTRLFWVPVVCMNQDSCCWLYTLQRYIYRSFSRNSMWEYESGLCYFSEKLLFQNSWPFCAAY